MSGYYPGISGVGMPGDIYHYTYPQQNLGMVNVVIRLVLKLNRYEIDTRPQRGLAM